jgi:membrane-bound lytic murein transglycosylase D
MTGRGGAQKYVDKSYFGKEKMTLDGKTHWYIKRFLAHKIAFETIVEGKHSDGLKLTEYKKGKGKTLATIASNAKVSEEELKKYNKWLKKGKVPDEKVYTVLILTKGKSVKIKEPRVENKKAEKMEAIPEAPIEDIVVEKSYPSLDKGLNSTATIYVKINGLPCLLAKSTDDIVSLAKKSNLAPERLALYNDVQVTDAVKEGEIYYMKSKRNKGKIYFYTVQEGEELWDVSQKFGIKLGKLAKLNRMTSDDPLKKGRVLWLHDKRPENMPIEYRNVGSVIINRVAKKEVAIPIEEIVKKKKETKSSAAPIVLESKVLDSNEMEAVIIVEKKQSKREAEKQESTLENHNVLKGETLYGIARKYGVSVAQLLDWNNLEDAAISQGQYLLINDNSAQREKVRPKKKSIVFHEVQSGDTMYGISKRYDVPIDVLLDLNQKDNFNLSLGEKLRVKE